MAMKGLSMFVASRYRSTGAKGESIRDLSFRTLYENDGRWRPKGLRYIQDRDQRMVSGLADGRA